jgi:Flp pilus assembly protein TadG
VRRRSPRTGQAMVELAILLPLMILLFLGGWTAAGLIGDNDTALQATRAGARYAAELGNGGYPIATASCQGGFASNPCSADQGIIQQMVPILTGTMPNAVLTEIAIYEPTSCTNGGLFSTGTPDTSGGCPPNNGAYTAGENIDVYKPVAGVWTLQGTALYTLAMRDQVHPNEAELGVLIQFKYTSPTLSLFTQTDTQYTVVRLSPTE